MATSGKKSGGFGLAHGNAKPPSAFDLNTAKTLMTALRLAGLLAGRRSRAEAWAEDVRKLRQVDGWSEGQIQKALGWLTANLRGPYTPHVYSGLAFRAKFRQILAAAAKDERQQHLLGQVTEEARVLAATWMLVWPDEEKADELQFIQTTLNRYRAWLARLQKHQGNLAPLAMYIYDAAQPAEALAEQHATAILRMSRAGEWHGPLRRYAWRADMPSAMRAGRKTAVDYCGMPTAFDMLMRELGCVSSEGRGRTNVKY